MARKILIWNKIDKNFKTILDEEDSWFCSLTILNNGDLTSVRENSVIIWHLYDNNNNFKNNTIYKNKYTISATASYNKDSFLIGIRENHINYIYLYNSNKTNKYCFEIIENRLNEHIDSIVLIDNKIAIAIGNEIQLWSNEFKFITKLIENNSRTRSLVVLKDNLRLAWIQHTNIYILQIKYIKLEKNNILIIKEKETVKKLLVLNNGILVSASYDFNIRMYNLKSEGNELIRVLKGHLNRVQSLALLANGDFMSGSEDGELILWNTNFYLEEIPNTNHLIKNNFLIMNNRENRNEFDINCLIELKNGDLVIGLPKQFLIWSHQNKNLSVVLNEKDRKSNFCSLIMLNNGKLVSLNEKNDVITYPKANNLKVKEIVYASTKLIYATSVAALSDNDNSILIGLHDGNRNHVITESKYGFQIKTVNTTAEIESIIIIENNNIAVACDNEIHVFTSEYKLLASFVDNKHNVKSLVSLKDRIRLAWINDLEIKIWNISNTHKLASKDMCILKIYIGYKISKLLVLNDGALVSACFDSVIRIYNPNNGYLIQALKGHTNPVKTLAFVSNGNLLISGSYNGELIIWNMISQTNIGSYVCKPIDQYKFSAGIGKRSNTVYKINK